jgi:RNA polymerase sigma-70 factor (ECF subfamily)
MRQIGSGALELDADIRKTARGDHSAFGRIVEAYQGRIFAYLGRMGLDRTTAEDIAQDTFLRTWRNAGQFDPKLGGLTTWILTIARNLALTHLSRPVRQFELGGAEEPADAASDLPQPDETPTTRMSVPSNIGLRRKSVASSGMPNCPARHPCQRFMSS